MRKYRGFALWLIGLALLIFLVNLPTLSIHETLSKESATQKKGQLPLEGKVIVLDPGHGGPDGGAVAKDGTNEKEIALQVAKRLRDYLSQTGAIVYLTRETDEDLASDNITSLSKRKAEDIRKRLEIIETKEADLFISVHLNAVPSSRWRGAQTFYYPELEESEMLAKAIQTSIRTNLNNTDREHLSIHNMYLLKNASIPSVLVEIGFLSNPEELALLKQADYQRQIAASIYEGITKFSLE